MGTVLIIAMFASTMAALHFTTNESAKRATLFNVITLCLIVATAYQFYLIESIILLAVIAIGGFIGIKFFSKNKKI